MPISGCGKARSVTSSVSNVPPSLVRSVAEDDVDPSPLWKSYVDLGWTAERSGQRRGAGHRARSTGSRHRSHAVLGDHDQFAPLVADRFDPHASGTAVYNGVRRTAMPRAGCWTERLATYPNG